MNPIKLLATHVSESLTIINHSLYQHSHIEFHTPTFKEAFSIPF